jgi:predicted kinase
VAPLLIVFAGLPGSGKSTLAQEIARRQHAIWVRVDTAEAAMLRSGLVHSFETGLAAYVVAQDLAAENLGLGWDVVIDAVNGVEEAREMWRSLARDQEATLFFVEVVCRDPAEHRRRVDSREAPTPPVPVPTWEDVITREYRPWEEPLLSIDSTRPLQENVDRIVHHISSRTSS